MPAISEEDKSLLVVAVLCEDDAGVIDWNDVKRYLPGSFLAKTWKIDLKLSSPLTQS